MESNSSKTRLEEDFDVTPSSGTVSCQPAQKEIQEETIARDSRHEKRVDIEQGAKATAVSMGQSSGRQTENGNGEFGVTCNDIAEGLPDDQQSQVRLDHTSDSKTRLFVWSAERQKIHSTADQNNIEKASQSVASEDRSPSCPYQQVSRFEKKSQMPRSGFGLKPPTPKSFGLRNSDRPVSRGNNQSTYLFEESSTTRPRLADGSRADAQVEPNPSDQPGQSTNNYRNPKSCADRGRCSNQLQSEIPSTSKQADELDMMYRLSAENDQKNKFHIQKHSFDHLSSPKTTADKTEADTVAQKMTASEITAESKRITTGDQDITLPDNTAVNSPSNVAANTGQSIKEKSGKLRVKEPISPKENRLNDERLRSIILEQAERRSSNLCGPSKPIKPHVLQWIMDLPCSSYVDIECVSRKRKQSSEDHRDSRDNYSKKRKKSTATPRVRKRKHNDDQVSGGSDFKEKKRKV